EAGAFDAAARRNRAVTDMFEPGSTLKPLVIARALDTGAVAENAIIFCENGKLEVSGHTIRDGKGYGWLSLEKIIEKSSNIGAARIGQALGRQRLGELLFDLGFGRRSGIGLPGETPGIVRPSKSWSEVGLVNISFGHGVALSAVQLAAAYRSLAADGLYLTPTLVADAEDREERRVFSRGATAKVAKMMVKATGAEGTGALAAIDGYRVAGKTGTAQKIDPVSGGYSREAHVAVFAGFVPADDPAAVIVVVVDEAKPLYSGGKVAAPVFASVARATMRELSRVPDESLLADPVVADIAPEVAVGALPRGQDVALAAALAAARGGTPSFVGMTAREVLDAYSRRELTASLELSGTGVVTEQSPRPGAPLKGPLKLSLSPGEGFR
ncbi:MAG: penicillin-binding transpeptidase domain-containing protein, partial [Myxococcota bacterium]